jgi:uncharacterized protein YwqG
MLSEDISTLLRATELSRVAEELEFLVMPSIRLKATRISENDLHLGTSKLGGLPDLPPHLQWPTWKGTPLAFIAQINLAEVHAFDSEEMLPASGILYFFYDAEHVPVGYDPAWRGGWRVLYEDQKPLLLNRVPVPAALLETKSLWLPEEQHYTACKLAFSVEATLPPDDSLSLTALQLSKKEQNAYEELLRALNKKHHEPIHRLLGYPDALQGDMQVECQLVSSGLNLGNGKEYFSEQGKLLRSGVQAWQLLLQIDTDPAPQMVWGIEGRIYYWIRREALQARSFEDTWFIMQWG